MFKLQYRFVISAANALAGAIPTIAVGYGNVVAGISEPAKIFSLNEAISKGMAFNRRFQASGIDTVVDVYGMPIDDGLNNPVTPARVLTAGELAEQHYGKIDTPDFGLKKAISLANHEAGGNVALVDQLPEDVG